MEINVQFSDPSQAVVVTYLCCPQDPAVFLNQGTVKDSDPRWKAYYDSIPLFLQQSMPSPDVG